MAKGMRGHISVVGAINTDVFMLLDDFPRRGETCLALRVDVAAGGKGANQAVQCARLGARVYLYGCVGDDEFSRTLLGALAGYGVCCDYVRKTPGPSGLAVAHRLADGGVCACVAPGANAKVDIAMLEQNKTLWRSRSILLQQEIGPQVVLYVLRRAHDLGIYTVLNAAPYREATRAGLPLASCLVLNEVECAGYLGRAFSSPRQVQESSGGHPGPGGARGNRHPGGGGQRAVHKAGRAVFPRGAGPVGGERRGPGTPTAGPTPCAGAWGTARRMPAALRRAPRRTSSATSAAWPPCPAGRSWDKNLTP